MGLEHLPVLCGGGLVRTRVRRARLVGQRGAAGLFETAQPLAHGVACAVEGARDLIQARTRRGLTPFSSEIESSAADAAPPHDATAPHPASPCIATPHRPPPRVSHDLPALALEF